MATGLTAKDYYVSPEGSDNNVGSKQRPLATLTGARDAIREAGIAGREPVNVVLADGIHLLDESFVLEPRDSGSEKAPVIYKAENRGKAIVSGATRLTGLRWERHKGGVLKARVPDHVLQSCKFDAVTIGGRKLHMARFPNFTGRGNFDGVTSLERALPRAISTPCTAAAGAASTIELRAKTIRASSWKAAGNRTGIASSTPPMS